MTDEITLDSQALEEFKAWLVDNYNEDVYYQLKDYLTPYENYSQAMDYFLENLHGNVVWQQVT